MHILWKTSVRAMLIAATICSCTADNKKETAAPTPTDSLPAVTDGGEEWTRSGMNGITGLRLETDGRAATVNMPRLHYETWERNGDTLLVSGKAGDGDNAVAVTDVYIADNDTLTLYIGGQPALKYVRKARQ